MSEVLAVELDVQDKEATPSGAQELIDLMCEDTKDHDDFMIWVLQQK